MSGELTTNQRALLAREVAADRRIGGGGWYNDNMREVFNAGWDAALAWVEEQQQQRDRELTEAIADGRYCRHHDDDPAHGAICYHQAL